MTRLQRAGAWGAAHIRRAAVGVAAFLVLAVVGCTGGPTDTPASPPQALDPYANIWTWEWVESQATSDFEREVLADRAITAEEYAEAHQRWLACMEEVYPPQTSGVTITLILRADALYEFQVEAGSGSLPQDYDLNNGQCMTGTIGLIAPMYGRLLINPDLRPMVDVVIECLQRHGLVDDSYTAANFQADQIKDHPYPTTIRPDGTEEQVPIAEFDPSQVTDLDMKSAEVLACLSNPSL